MRNISGVSITVLAMLAACTGQSTTRAIDAYYDVRGLFVSQAVRLQGAEFEKRALIDGKEETATVDFDSLEWTKELSMFINMDINKTALVGAYEMQSTPTSDGNLIRYSKKPGSDAGVQWIELMQNAKGQVVSFSGFFREENALYETQRELHADFAVSDGMPVMVTYSISGYQKILLKDTVTYTVSAGIRK